MNQYHKCTNKISNIFSLLPQRETTPDETCNIRISTFHLRLLYCVWVVSGSERERERERLLFICCPAISRERGRNAAICLTVKLLNGGADAAAALLASPLSRCSNFSADMPRLVRKQAHASPDAGVGRRVGARDRRVVCDAMRCDATRCDATRCDEMRRAFHGT